MLNTHTPAVPDGAAPDVATARAATKRSALIPHGRGTVAGSLAADPRDAGLVAADNPHGGVIWQRPGTWQPTDPA